MRTHAERYIYSITSMACTNDALRLAARLIIYSGDENAMRPALVQRADLIPCSKGEARIRELELFKESRLWSFGHAFFGRIEIQETRSSEIKIGPPPEASASIWRAYYHASSSLPRIRRMPTSSLPRVSIPLAAPSFCRSHQQLSQL